MTRRAIMSIARKNGKTALIAALVLVHLCGPEAQINSDIASAANDKEQAAMVFKYVRQIVQLSPQLTAALDVIESKKRVVYHGRGNVYAALSAEAGTKHGMNPTVVIYDELAQSKNTELFDTLETAQGAQHEPIFFTISTQSHDPQHPLSQMIDDALADEDDSIVCHLYEVPEEVEDVFNPECWYSANPALGDFRSLEELTRYAERAKRLPSKENVLRNLYLNQRVTLDATLFPRSVWMACAGEVTFDSNERVFLALDFAQTTDLCSLAMLGEDTGHLQAFFWKPEGLMEEHGRRDRRDYALWLKQGFMEPCPGKTIDPDAVARKIAWIYENYSIAGLAYDRWRIDQIIKALDRQQIDASQEETAQLRVFPWGQGFRDMSPAIDALEQDVIEEKLTHPNSPILNWNIANAIVAQDPAGNRKFDKAKTRMRIDGAVAAAMVVGLKDRHREEDKVSIYASEKPIIV
ncbi:MAG: terminase large subunit [Pseudomonadales bacterium]|nr:terminase large subunit [Pseudomonadales bacterium]